MNFLISFQSRLIQDFLAQGWTFRVTVMMLLLVASNRLLFGQTNQLETDKGIAASIAPYDSEVRQAILQASQHPEILIPLQKSQE